MEKEKWELCQALRKGDEVDVLIRSHKQWVTVVFKQNGEVWLRKSLHRHSMHILPVQLEHILPFHAEGCKKHQLLLLEDNNPAEK